MEMNGTIMIAQPVETVAAYVFNVENDVYWRNGITGSGLRDTDSWTIGTVGYSEVGGKEYDWRIVSYTSGESVDWELLNSPFKGMGGYRFKSVEGGTHFTLVADVYPSGLYKLIGPLFVWIGRRRNQADVERLRDILESTPA